MYVKSSKGWAGSLVRGAMEGSGFSKFWLVMMTILALAFALTIPLGCMSPPTRYFTFFSVDPQVLAHRYNRMVANNTGKMLYDDERLSADLVVLPDIYRVGMSGVCREFTNSSEIRCTAHFPQHLDLRAVIDADVRDANLTNSTSSHLLTFWDSFFLNETMTQNMDSRTTFIQAAAGLTVTSLATAPIGFTSSFFLYKRDKPGYTTIAICYALLDAAFIVAAAVLWIFASVQYVADIESALGGQSIANTPYWNTVPQYPPSYGIIVLSAAALAKVIVLPVLAVMFLFVLMTAGFAVVLIIVVALLLVKCIIAMCCSTTVVYY